LFNLKPFQKPKTQNVCTNKIHKPKNAAHHPIYEPTRAIACNDADWRRWVRVKEWFNDYLLTEKFNLENKRGHIIELLKSTKF